MGYAGTHHRAVLNDHPGMRNKGETVGKKVLFTIELLLATAVFMITPIIIGGPLLVLVVVVGFLNHATANKQVSPQITEQVERE